MNPILIVYQNSKDRGKKSQRQNAKLDGHAPQQLIEGANVDKNIEAAVLKSEVTCSMFGWSVVEERSRS